MSNVFPFAHLQRPWIIAGRLQGSELLVPGLTPLQVQLLHNRGINGGECTTFLQANWHTDGPPLADLAEAVDRIQTAIAGEEHVVVFGDYDCDGITSCALLTRALRLLGAKVTPFIPTREDDGRGLNVEAVQWLAGQGATLLITTDCGTSNVEEALLAQRLGMQVIVTDHHPLHGTTAGVQAMLNPQRPDDTSGSQDLAGVGVAFRLAEALAARAGYSELHNQLATLLDLVAIGTIADVVPLSRENWALAHTGLELLRISPSPGIAALVERAGLNPPEISERDVSFSLAPRLNAAGRLGSPRVALDLLLTTDLEEARKLALELDELNGERQRLTEDVLVAAREQVTAVSLLPPVLIVHGHDWPLGILGLVAGRLADDYQRPTFVVSSNSEESRGSARGRSGVDLGKILANWPGEFKRFGGHAQAAGFTLATGDLDRFTRYIEEVFAATAALASPEMPIGEAEYPPLAVDCVLPLSSISEDRFRAIRALAPFGGGYTEPVFTSEGAKILRCWQSGPEGRNLRLMLGEGRSRVSFLWSKQGSLLDAVQAKLPWLGPVDVVYTLDGYRRRDGSFEVMPRILTMRPAFSS
jgi:single-stranded-DNA-specific exonuclease